MTTPTPGAPTWVDLATADLDKAKYFYGHLFGWAADDDDSYTTFRLNGRPVAGAGPLSGADQPTAWSIYFATDDADAVAARVVAAGGTVLLAPLEVGDQGRLAAFLDPAGAPFSVWQPWSMPGAELFGIPGAVTWNELNTRDLEGSVAFYGAVFGWLFRNNPVNGLPYLVAELNGAAVAAIQPMLDNEWPPDTSPHWMVYFAVYDCDRAIERVDQLGGRALTNPADLPLGRSAVIEDPSGGIFSIVADTQSGAHRDY